MDANKIHGEKAWRQLRTNATSHIEQILETTSHKTAAILSPTPISKTIQIRWTRHARHCWRNKGKLISDVLLLTPSHGRAGVGRLTKNYLQQLYTDTVYSLEDLPNAMDDRDEWRKRVWEICAHGMTWWWWCVQMSLLSLTFCLFSVSVSLDTLMLILVLGERGHD